MGIRSLSTEEAADIPSLNTTIFYDYNMRRDANWMDRVVDSLNDNVYITIDVDGFDPAIMPATGTPEPGGLSWYEGLALLRKVIEKRNVVGWDIVELSPDGRQRRAELPLREADLQDARLQIRQSRRRAVIEPRQTGFFSASSSRFASALNGESGNSSTMRLNVCCASATLPASRYVRPS